MASASEVGLEARAKGQLGAEAEAQIEGGHFGMEGRCRRTV